MLVNINQESGIRRYFCHRARISGHDRPTDGISLSYWKTESFIKRRETQYSRSLVLEYDVATS